MTHKIPLTNASVLLLTNILSVPGWAKTIPDIVLGGELLTKKFTALSVRKNDAGHIDIAWASEAQEWEFTEAQRECCKTAINSAASAGYIPPGNPATGLIEAFGLFP